MEQKILAVVGSLLVKLKMEKNVFFKGPAYIDFINL